MDNTTVFAIMIAVIVLIGIIGLILYRLKVSETYPFKKMRKKDLDKCYDLDQFKSKHKKKN